MVISCGNRACADTTDDQQLDDGWYTLQVNGAPVYACSAPCLRVVEQFATTTTCARDDCRNTASTGHLYCTAVCREQDQRDGVGLATVWGSSNLTERVTAIRARQALLPTGAF